MSRLGGCGALCLAMWSAAATAQAPSEEVPVPPAERLDELTPIDVLPNAIERARACAGPEAPSDCYESDLVGQVLSIVGYAPATGQYAAFEGRVGSCAESPLSLTVRSQATGDVVRTEMLFDPDACLEVPDEEIEACDMAARREAWTRLAALAEAGFRPAHNLIERQAWTEAGIRGHAPLVTLREPLGGHRLYARADGEVIRVTLLPASDSQSPIQVGEVPIGPRYCEEGECYRDEFATIGQADVFDGRLYVHLLIVDGSHCGEDSQFTLSVPVALAAEPPAETPPPAEHPDDECDPPCDPLLEVCWQGTCRILE